MRVLPSHTLSLLLLLVLVRVDVVVESDGG